MTQATIVGGAGFIGSALATRLRSEGVAVTAPGRDEPLDAGPYGVLYYCAGVTGDFRQRPLETVDAHVDALANLLRHTEVERLVYLSSARVYLRADQTTEDAAIRLDSSDPDQLYDISKLMGEAVCQTHQNAISVRLSHVVGDQSDSPNFLPQLIRSATRERRILLRTGLTSTRDYVALSDAVDVLLWLGNNSCTGILNVASGRATTHQELLAVIADHTGASIEVSAEAPVVSHPAVDITRLRELLPGFMPRDVVDEVRRLLVEAPGAQS